MFPARYFRHLHGVEWLREQYRTYLRRRPRRQLMPEFFRHQTTDVRVFLDMPDTIWEDLRKEINSQIDHFAYPMKQVAALAGTSRSS